MKTYHIGLDFGTYQTKACIYDLKNEVHEFFLFPGTNSYFLPSIVGLKKDGTFEYGMTNGNAFKKEFHYFKIASAEDEEFRLETFDKKDLSNIYRTEEFDPYTPEFLSVIYLTHILFLIKEQYDSRVNKPQTEKVQKGFLNKLFAKDSGNEELRFTIQLGIPTEWSQIKNLRRKRKFQSILMIAELLQKKYKSQVQFLETTSEKLIAQIKEIYQQQTIESTDQFDAQLNALGISVFPETAAGLTFIVKTRQLLPGHYAIMDIGGGTTDISFFMVEHGHVIKYLASESYILAANNVYKHLADDEESIDDISNKEKEAQERIKSGVWLQDEQLKAALAKVRKGLNKQVYKLFNRRIYRLHPGRMVNKYRDQPIIVYGGGSMLPYFNCGPIEIYDNGNFTSITIDCATMEKQGIEQFATGVNVLPEDGSWKSDLCLLVVALGLSYIKPDSFSNWFGDDDYQPIDILTTTSVGAGQRNFKVKNEIPHPFNEGCYIYDVIASKWNN